MADNLMVPAVSSEVSPGGQAWTSNGKWEIEMLTIADHDGMARVAAVSRCLHRRMNCGFLLHPEDVDRFCREWLSKRGEQSEFKER